MRATTIGLFAAVTVLSCDGGGAADRSYCEALCDWAVACNASERPIDEAAAGSACLDATHAVDDGCEKAETGGLDPASAELLKPCVSAVDDQSAAGECGAFVGTLDEIKLGTTPAECAGQGTDAQATFEAARDATTETGDELCQRATDTFCHRAEDCILGDHEIPSTVTEATGTVFENCQKALDPAYTADCKSSALYAPEEDLTDANAPRQAARDCLPDFATVACDDLFDGTGSALPETCAAMFTTPQQLADVATALYDLEQQYAPYAQ